MSYGLFNLKERETDSLSKEKDKVDERHRMRATAFFLSTKKEKKVWDKYEGEIKMQKGARLQK